MRKSSVLFSIAALTIFTSAPVDNFSSVVVPQPGKESASMSPQMTQVKIHVTPAEAQAIASTLNLDELPPMYKSGAVSSKDILAALNTVSSTSTQPAVPALFLHINPISATNSEKLAMLSSFATVLKISSENPSPTTFFMVSTYAHIVQSMMGLVADTDTMNYYKLGCEGSQPNFLSSSYKQLKELNAQVSGVSHVLDQMHYERYLSHAARTHKDHIKATQEMLKHISRLVKHPHYNNGDILKQAHLKLLIEQTVNITSGLLTLKGVQINTVSELNKFMSNNGLHLLALPSSAQTDGLIGRINKQKASLTTETVGFDWTALSESYQDTTAQLSTALKTVPASFQTSNHYDNGAEAAPQYQQSLNKAVTQYKQQVWHMLAYWLGSVYKDPAFLNNSKDTAKLLYSALTVKSIDGVNFTSEYKALGYLSLLHKNGFSSRRKAFLTEASNSSAPALLNSIVSEYPGLSSLLDAPYRDDSHLNSQLAWQYFLTFIGSEVAQHAESPIQISQSTGVIEFNTTLGAMMHKHLTSTDENVLMNLLAVIRAVKASNSRELNSLEHPAALYQMQSKHVK